MTPDPDATHTAPSEITHTAVPEITRTAVPDDATKPSPGSSVATDAPPGFVIERELGRGGMGVVYLARQIGLNRPVALKLIQAGDSGSALRFLAEAEAMAAVRHPQVAEVYHFGEHAGRPYLALEYCPGGDLTKLRNEPEASATAGANRFRTAADLMAKVADGVAAAHAAGIVHRDLKPHNVLLSANGTPKVTDFGLAKRDGGSGLTKTNAIMGTPAYMPPEQAKGETKFVGPPADVWALGVMLYEALTGTRPFTGADHWAVLAAVQRGTFAPPRTVEKDIPRDLELICLKCLKTEPHERYPSAAELATDLHNWLDGKPISARPVGVIEQATKWAKRNRKLAVMGLAVFLTMAVATAVSLGFGLEAEKQASIAKDEKEKTEKETERTQRMLARALLAPISHKGDANGKPICTYEEDALWELTSVRRGPVPLMLLEQATGSELAVWQFMNRAEYLDHAAVGLDSQKRQDVDALFTRRLGEKTLSDEWRDCLAVGVHYAERYAADEQCAVDLNFTRILIDRRSEDLAAILSRIHSERARQVLVKAITSLSDHVAETQSNERDVTELLIGAVQCLPPEERSQFYRAAAERSVKALGYRSGELQIWELTERIAALVRRLPVEKAADVSGKAAELLLSLLDKETTYGKRWAMANGLASVAEWLPADRWAGMLSKALGKAMGVHERRALAFGIAAVASRLPTDRSAEVCEKAAGVLLAASEQTVEWFDLHTLTEGLAALTQWVPMTLSDRLCTRAADRLLVVLEGDKERRFRREQFEALLKICGRLSLNKAKGVLVVDKGRTAFAAALGGMDHWMKTEREYLIKGLVEMCRLSPSEKAAEELLAAFERATTEHERPQLAIGLAAVCARLPGKVAEGMCGKVAPVLARELEEIRATRRRFNLFGRAWVLAELAEGLAAVATYLPEDRSVQLCSLAAEELAAALASAKDEYHGWTLAKALQAVCKRLPAEEAKGLAQTAHERLFELAADELRSAISTLTSKDARWKGDDVAKVVFGVTLGNLAPHQQRQAFAVVAGVPVLHPDVLPKPKPLPPQQLVELLKHPFCVKEARRAVLDALEFTYDRKFKDLWEFVAFAEKEHPELDLLTPPKRPQK